MERTIHDLTGVFHALIHKMLICFYFETLGKGCIFIAVLLQVFQWTSEAARPLESKTAAVGSSVLLSAPDNTKDIKFLQWEYLNDNKSHFIVQYYAVSPEPTIYGPYGDRVIFYLPNGSLLLEKLQETDSGVYKASINLIESEARRTLLKVLRPVSQPQIWSNSSLAGSPIELFCNVPEGTVENIDWEKEGRPLPQERCYLLSESPSVLHIGKGEKSDCGSYSCNVSNEISWQESSLNLTIVGISPPLEHALKMSAVALVFALVSGMGFFVLCCQSGKQRIKGETWRWMSVFLQGLVCVSSVLLFAATVLWMQEEGPSAAFILLQILFVYVIIITALISATLVCQPAKLSGFKTKPWQRVILDSAAPGAVILVVLFASLLLQKISQLQEVNGILFLTFSPEKLIDQRQRQKVDDLGANHKEDKPAEAALSDLICGKPTLGEQRALKAAGSI
ncbi:glycine N-acyltransferase-like protein 3-like [Platysternon megacephalum]|uniref:Glycine N-acyltransferase-like protein 3-like n=1 Tax=Platysternon megacephalum TaxID=55544 RepID=A0A4D9DY81_9SAUR|nr:glycine N-acyltransferase-like protein 3-like [Platysternon megacephalum]